MGIFQNKDQMKAPFEFEYGAGGEVYMYAIAGNAIVAKTPYQITVNEYGPLAVSLTDITVLMWVGVAVEDASSGDLAKFQIGGSCEDVITPSLSMSVGYGFTINAGAVADIGADYSGAPGEFAIAATETTTATTQDMVLVPQRILSLS